MLALRKREFAFETPRANGADGEVQSSREDFVNEQDLEEEAFVMRLRKNGVVVLVPKYGLEAPVFLTGPADPRSKHYVAREIKYQGEEKIAEAVHYVRIRTDEVRTVNDFEARSDNRHAAPLRT